MRKINSSIKRVASVIAAGMLVVAMAVPSMAADYTYKCTVSGGLHGTISKDAEKSYKDTYTLTPADVTVKDANYYVKGFAVAGSDVS